MLLMKMKMLVDHLQLTEEHQKNLDQFLKNAVRVYLELAENTVRNQVFEEQLKDDDKYSLYYMLKELGYTTERLNAIYDASTEAKTLVCKCGSTKFNVDCSMIVCTKCKQEYFCKTDATTAYCKQCDGYLTGQCEASQSIDIKD